MNVYCGKEKRVIRDILSKVFSFQYHRGGKKGDPEKELA